MRKIITSVLGILCGISIIVMAFQFNSISYEAGSAKLTTLGVDPSIAYDSYSASYESDEYYGGDAYTGIQQAAAQTANNVLALEETLNQTNNDLVAINRNLKNINSNLVNAIREQENTNATYMSICVKMGFFTLLAFGGLTIVKYLRQLLDGIAEKRESESAEIDSTASFPEENSFTESVT